MLCFYALFHLSCDYGFSRILVAQNTNAGRVVASASQIGPTLSVECLDFHFVRQNLARDKTVDHSGTTGLVKVNSTTRIQYMHPMVLIQSVLSRLSRMGSLLPKALFLATEANGTPPQPTMLSLCKCPVFNPRNPQKHIPREQPVHPLLINPDQGCTQLPLRHHICHQRIQMSQVDPALLTRVCILPSRWSTKDSTVFYSRVQKRYL